MTPWRSAPRSTAAAQARVVVIGAGFIGAEVASTCAALGCRVTVLEALDIPLRPVLGPELGRHCASLYGAHGVDLKTERVGDRAPPSFRRRCARIAGPVGAGSRWSSTDGEIIAADVVVVGIGVAPSTGWLNGSGLEVEQRRRL